MVSAAIRWPDLAVFLCMEGHLPRPFAHISPQPDVPSPVMFTLPPIPSVYAGARLGRRLPRCAVAKSQGHLGNAGSGHSIHERYR
jgi:hypothetical protein